MSFAGGAPSIRVREYGSDASDRADPHELKTATPEVAANTILCLAYQASYLLGRQLRKLEERFLSEGGFTERLYRQRRERRDRF